MASNPPRSAYEEYMNPTQPNETARRIDEIGRRMLEQREQIRRNSELLNAYRGRVGNNPEATFTAGIPQQQAPAFQHREPQPYGNVPQAPYNPYEHLAGGPGPGPGPGPGLHAPPLQGQYVPPRQEVPVAPVVPPNPYTTANLQSFFQRLTNPTLALSVMLELKPLIPGFRNAINTGEINSADLKKQAKTLLLKYHSDKGFTGDPNIFKELSSIFGEQQGLDLYGQGKHKYSLAHARAMEHHSRK